MRIIVKIKKQQQLFIHKKKYKISSSNWVIFDNNYFAGYISPMDLRAIVIGLTH